MTRPHDDAPRRAAYALLARLHLRGATPDLLPVLREVPDLADRLLAPPPPDRSAAAGAEVTAAADEAAATAAAADEAAAVAAAAAAEAGTPADRLADELAAEHHRLFELEVPPFASTFLEADGRLGGVTTREVEDLYRAAGLAPGDPSAAGEHVGNLLALLGTLSGRGEGSGSVSSAVLDHLLAWVPPLLAAVERRGSPFQARVGALTLALLVDHRRALPSSASRPPLPAGLTHPLEDPLGDARAGLAQLARHLTTPVRAGLLLGPGDLREVAREHGLPGGFGPRSRVLETMLRAAGSFGVVEAVTASLRRRVRREEGALNAIEGKGLAQAFLEPWRRRLAGTDRVLVRVAEAVG